MGNLSAKRNDYITSCEQLMTISCILAGFAFSGLIALPGIDQKLYEKILTYFSGNFDFSFYYTFSFLFFSTLCFLGTILTILVYKASGYLIPIKKLHRVHLISNLIFSTAVASLFVSVIVFGIPTQLGLMFGIFVGIGVGGCFVWENLVPWQKNKRIQQLSQEKEEDIPHNN